jgi:hypothetical protein
MTGIIETESSTITGNATIISCLGAAQTQVVKAVRGSGKVVLYDHLGSSHDMVVFIPEEGVTADEVINLIHEEVAKTMVEPTTGLKLATAPA